MSIGARRVSIGAFEKHIYHFQSKFNLVLLEFSLCKPIKGLDMSENRADERNVIKPATEGATELVHEELRLARVGRSHNGRGPAQFPAGHRL